MKRLFMSVFVLVCTVCFSTTAIGGVLNLSGFSSDATPAEVLDAVLEFEVSGSMLTLQVTNETEYPFEYYMNQVFFNASEGINLTESLFPDGWALSYNQEAAPFGTFDFALTTDK